VLPNCFFSKAGAKVMQIFHMRKNKLKNLVYFNKMRAIL